MAKQGVRTGEAAKILGISRQHLNRLVRDSQIKPAAHSPGGQPYWDVADLRRMLEDANATPSVRPAAPGGTGKKAPSALIWLPTAKSDNAGQLKLAANDLTALGFRADLGFSSRLLALPNPQRQVALLQQLCDQPPAALATLASSALDDPAWALIVTTCRANKVALVLLTSP